MVLDCLFGIDLSGASLLLSLATAITRKPFKIFIVKQEKHDAIKLLAQSKLDSITNIISQAIQDGDISPTEFHKVLQEVEKYHKLKADIRNQAKAKVKEITKEQREEILEEGTKEGISEPKIISFHLVMVSLMASSISTFVFIQFQQGIFNFFASSNRDVFFIYL